MRIGQGLRRQELNPRRYDIRRREWAEIGTTGIAHRDGLAGVKSLAEEGMVGGLVDMLRILRRPCRHKTERLRHLTIGDRSRRANIERRHERIVRWGIRSSTSEGRLSRREHGAGTDGIDVGRVREVPLRKIVRNTLGIGESRGVE